MPTNKQPLEELEKLSPDLTAEFEQPKTKEKTYVSVHPGHRLVYILERKPVYAPDGRSLVHEGVKEQYIQFVHNYFITDDPLKQKSIENSSEFGRTIEIFNPNNIQGNMLYGRMATTERLDKSIVDKMTKGDLIRYAKILDVKLPWSDEEAMTADITKKMIISKLV